VDDLLGVFGAEAETGKSTLGDLREGKCTVLIASATTTPAWALNEPLLGRPGLSEEQTDGVRDLFTPSGARSFADSLARYYANRAPAWLGEPHIPAAPRTELHALAETVLSKVK
jgi:geranylgeranyl diphosphate synthase type II